MGADLYYQNHNHNYFRDCYNSYGLSTNLGFSWWQDVIPKLNKNYELKGKKIKEVIDIVEKNLKTFENTKYLVYKEECFNDLVSRGKELLEYLKNAYDDKISIECSL